MRDQPHWDKPGNCRWKARFDTMPRIVMLMMGFNRRPDITFKIYQDPGRPIKAIIMILKKYISLL